MLFVLCFVESAKLCPTLCNPMNCMQHARVPCPSSRVCSNSCSIDSVLPSNHIILYCPLLLLSSVFPSIRVFSKELALCIWWPKYWSFSFSISPSNEYSRLISFRIHWFDLLAVQGCSNNQLSSWGETLRVGVFASGINIPTVGLPL